MLRASTPKGVVKGAKKEYRIAPAARYVFSRVFVREERSSPCSGKKYVRQE
jgi:hypothetical protein